MLSVIASSHPKVRDTFVKILSLESVDINPFAEVYRRGNWVFIHFLSPINSDHAAWIASTYLPDRLYLPFFAYSIDMVHEIGDIIVPNVYFSHDTALEKQEVTKENRDSFVKNPRFFETLTEQKDYYVEDFGLSVGGIIVENAPLNPNEDSIEKMMLAYEADAYVTDSLESSLKIVEEDETVTLIVSGIVNGKTHSKHPNLDPYEVTARNMMTTFRLLEEE